MKIRVDYQARPQPVYRTGARNTEPVKPVDPVNLTEMYDTVRQEVIKQLRKEQRPQTVRFKNTKENRGTQLDVTA